MKNSWARLIQSPARAFAAIFVLGFTLRFAFLFSGVLPSNYMRPFGEIGKVAISLARTGEFADPYKIPTGPTAHPTPVYAGIHGLICDAFGTGATSAYVRGVLAITCFSALYAMLPWLGIRLGLGARAGLLAGLAGAVFPQQRLLEVTGGSDNLFPGMALGLLAVAFLSRWTAARYSVAGSILLGLACGLALHLSPPMLFVLTGWVAFELVWSRDRRRWLHAACIILAAIVVCLPWAWRNYKAFDTFLFVRGNFGLELRLANYDGADADMEVTFARDPEFPHPSVNMMEAIKVRELGETAYMRQARQQALTWIRQHPLRFMGLTLTRAFYFWFGPLSQPWLFVPTALTTILALFGLRRALPTLSTPQRAAVLIPLAAFPLVYYVISFVGHYRSPLEWMLLLLAGVQVTGPRGVSRA